MNEIVQCNICKSPWHPATGHFISETMVWCGPCTREWVKEVCGMQNRRWGGEKFYNHATVPPPAKETEFTFSVDHFTRKDETNVFQIMTLTASGVNLEEAYMKIEHQIPPGKKVWCWTESGK